jgi:hypothetical protein
MPGMLPRPVAELDAIEVRITGFHRKSMARMRRLSGRATEIRNGKIKGNRP